MQIEERHKQQADQKELILSFQYRSSFTDAPVAFNIEISVKQEIVITQIIY
jgi:hypothetical protein